MTAALLAALLAFRAEVAVGGAVLCAEGRGLLDRPGGRDELAAIAQVAINRARRSGRSVRAELLAPLQFATACPLRDRRRFEALFAGVRLGVVRPPAWATRALAFVAPYALGKVRAAWSRNGYEPLHATDTVHVFWQLRPAGALVAAAP